MDAGLAAAKEAELLAGIVVICIGAVQLLLLAYGYHVGANKWEPLWIVVVVESATNAEVGVGRLAHALFLGPPASSLLASRRSNT